MDKIPIRCRLKGRILVLGFPTRVEYIFEESNNYIVQVESENVPDLLSKTRHYRACCNGNDENLSIFELVE